ncbi:MAG: hypothetical protein FWG47_05035 [Propionibacteriaceae bacterium]|nr:hypothetical protein [Propionibacteriaceae bacterium]
MSTTSGAAAPENSPETQGQPEAPAPGPVKDELKFTQTDLDKIIAGRIAPLQAKAAEYDKLVEAQKTDAQRQADKLGALQAKLEAYEAAEARREAAKVASLPPEAHDLVTGSTPEEIGASVAKVAALIASIGAPRTPAPVPAAGQGTTHKPGADWLRDFVGRK